MRSYSALHITRLFRFVDKSQCNSKIFYDNLSDSHIHKRWPAGISFNETIVAAW